jgi:hypothetical protein
MQTDYLQVTFLVKVEAEDSLIVPANSALFGDFLPFSTPIPKLRELSFWGGGMGPWHE